MMNPTARSRSTSSPISVTPLLIKMTKQLANMFHLRINIKSVLSEFSRYRHVGRFPCKDVPILTNEFDERAFLFRIYPSPNGELLRRITRDKIILLGIFRQLKLKWRVILCGGLLQRGHIDWVNIIFVKLELLYVTGRL